MFLKEVKEVLVALEQKNKIMKIIIPMAGKGSRLRPHTLTTPKPLINLSGKTIIQHIVEDISKSCEESIDEIAFIIGDFGKDIEKKLISIANKQGAKGTIYYQHEALGTAHAILCAKESLEGNIVIAFADTLFRSNFKINLNVDGIIWVQKVEDPSAFGVVKVNKNNIISDFIEKPQTFVSDLAIIGIYYFKNGENLKEELRFLIKNNIKEKGEYQLTTALENMNKKGVSFLTGQVDEWLDCGNKNSLLTTNKRILDLKQTNNNPHQRINSKIKSPCYFGKNVILTNCTIGPYVSIGDNTKIENSVINNSMIQSDCLIKNANFNNAMIGNNVTYYDCGKNLDLGDFSSIK